MEQMGNYDDYFSSPEVGRASKAYGLHVTQGPSKPYESMSLAGMDATKSSLDSSPLAQHHETSAWISIEKAFVATRSSQYDTSLYDIDDWFDEAEEAFTRSLDFYDPRFDSPDHLPRIELSMFAMPLYKAWAKNEAVSGDALNEFHLEVAEIGQHCIDIHDEVAKTSEDDRKSMTGMIAEIAVLMAHNRSYRSGREIESMALPSTLRQNNSTHPGGIEERENKLRGNWDISVVGWNNGSWELTDKLQVKRVMQILGKPGYGTKTAGYTPDVTVVSFAEHVRPIGTNLDVIEGVQTLINTTKPKPTRQERTYAVAMSRELRTHIARIADVRGDLHAATADIYQTERRAPRHIRQRNRQQ